MLFEMAWHPAPVICSGHEGAADQQGRCDTLGQEAQLAKPEKGMGLVRRDLGAQTSNPGKGQGWTNLLPVAFLRKLEKFEY